MAEKTEKITKKQITKKTTKNVVSGRVYVLATFNNTLVNITDETGNTLFSGSSGAAGFKGARKSTPYAATATVEVVGRKAYDAGMRSVAVYIKGPGAGRDAALRALKTIGFDITMIADITPLAHNGPRPKKKRRV
jgi:small subunit ribosomal protein S11